MAGAAIALALACAAALTACTGPGDPPAGTLSAPGSSPTGKVPNAPKAKSGKKAPPGLIPYRSAITELKADQNIPPASSTHPCNPKGAMAIPQIPAQSIMVAPSN